MIPQLVRDERGNAAVEGSLYAVSLLMLISLIIIGGRVALARQTLDHVAFQAARTASLQRDAGSAQSKAVAEASATLVTQKLQCLDSSTQVDVSGFSAPLGQAAEVSVTTHCTITLDGTVGLIPGTIQLTSTATSPIDSWRAR